MKLTFQPSQLSSLVTGWRFYLALVLVFFLATFVRVIYLDADPPMGITKSQDFSTDPFSYLYFAKNQVEFGDSNPYHDMRWPVYEISTQNYFALGVYTLLGTGRAQGNLVGSLMNLLALLFIVLGIKNFGSRWGALFFLLFAGLNYTLIQFARSPFLEASQNFWLAASFYLFSLAQERQWMHLLVGAAAAAAAFFGKMLALFGVGIYIAVLFVIWLKDKKRRRETLRSALLFVGGYAAVTAIWFFAFFLPAAEQFKSYFLWQGLSLYGAPKSLQSLDMFIVQINWFLYERDFLGKLPFVTALGSIGGAYLIYRLLARGGKKEQSRLQTGWLALFVWTLFAFISLFPHNYRPLRYQTTIMLPLMGLAGLLLANWIKRLFAHKSAGGKKHEPNRYLLGVLWGLWFMPVLFTALLYAMHFDGLGDAFDFAINNVYWLSVLCFLIGFVPAVTLPRLVAFFSSWRKPGGVLIGLIVIAYAAVHIYTYVDWVDKRQYDLITFDRDMGAILAPDAVISGSYAVALTQENGLGSIHHMFGVDTSNVDYNFFKEFPITHLVIDQGNEDRARHDYPQVMSQAQLLATYGIRGYDVKLFRVAPAAGNQNALHYKPTDFEMASYWRNQGDLDSAQFYIERYLAKDIPNYSADMAMGTSYFNADHAQEALPYFEHAVDFSPRNLMARLYLGYAYIKAEATTQRVDYYDSALVNLKFCRKFVTREQNPQLAQTVDELENR